MMAKRKSNARFDPSESVRLFVAAEPPKDVLNGLHETLGILRTRYGGVKWEPVSKLHFTLKFLGSVPDSDISGIGIALRNAAARVPLFRARFGGVGCFPSAERPRVVWVGLESGREEMTFLRNAVEIELNTIGFALDKRQYKPHMTVGRIKSRIRLSSLDGWVAPDDEFRIDHIVLKKSRLTPQESFYMDLLSHPLEVQEQADSLMRPKGISKRGLLN